MALFTWPENRSKSHDREFDINAGNIKVNLGYTARHKNERAASVLEDKNAATNC